MKVAAKRIAAGKWGCNSGQACISPDYIVTTKSFAPKLVISLTTNQRQPFFEPVERGQRQHSTDSVRALGVCDETTLGMQLESLKKVLGKFYGQDPLRSPDLSRIVNSNHFNRLRGLMDDETVAGKIAFGGQSDEQQL